MYAADVKSRLNFQNKKYWGAFRVKCCFSSLPNFTEMILIDGLLLAKLLIDCHSMKNSG